MFDILGEFLIMAFVARDLCTFGEIAAIVLGFIMLRERSEKIPPEGFNFVLLLSNKLSDTSLRNGALKLWTLELTPFFLLAKIGELGRVFSMTMSLSSNLLRKSLCSRTLLSPAFLYRRYSCTLISCCFPRITRDEGSITLGEVGVWRGVWYFELRVLSITTFVLRGGIVELRPWLPNRFSRSVTSCSLLRPSFVLGWAI